MLSVRAETATGLMGAGMATGPAVVSKVKDVPFYETETWLGAIAILGATLIIVSLVNAITRFLQDRRDK